MAALRQARLGFGIEHGLRLGIEHRLRLGVRFGIDRKRLEQQLER
ncbi:hypothetical protein ACWCXE_21940 [Streptomyces sp. NPDC001780]